VISEIHRLTVALIVLNMPYLIFQENWNPKSVIKLIVVTEGWQYMAKTYGVVQILFIYANSYCFCWTKKMLIH